MTVLYKPDNGMGLLSAWAFQSRFPLAETAPGNAPIKRQRWGQPAHDRRGTIRHWVGEALGASSLFVILLVCLFVGG